MDRKFRGRHFLNMLIVAKLNNLWNDCQRIVRKQLGFHDKTASLHSPIPSNCADTRARGRYGSNTGYVV